MAIGASLSPRRQAVSLLGSSLAGFALVWWLASTRSSATVLAGATLMMVLPQIVLGPLLGALVDRWDRRRTMIAVDTLIALLSLGLAARIQRELPGVGTPVATLVIAAVVINQLLGPVLWQRAIVAVGEDRKNRTAPEGGPMS